VEARWITVSAYFNDAQRQATRDCLESPGGGFPWSAYLNEPRRGAGLRASIAVPLQAGLVFDLGGGGTFDVSVLAYANGVFECKPPAVTPSWVG